MGQCSLRKINTFMFYFRYRPWSDISVKELLYNEIYFSSVKEANDPYEGKFFVKFKSDKSKWEKVFQNNEVFFQFYDNRNLFDKVVDFFSDKPEWTLDEILALTVGNFHSNGIHYKDADSFVRTLNPHFANKFIGLQKYFVSFSRNCDNTLMWSHYASKHEGFCLIFNFEDNKVKQDYQKSKTELPVKEISDINPNCWAAKSQIPQNFDLHNVDYLAEIQALDGFTWFDKTNFQQHKQKIHDLYLQKSEAWEYEEESRILLEMDRGVLGTSKWSKNQRLFHYDFNQLVGIILGYRMEQEAREQIVEIIKEKIGTQSKEFGFCIFEAKLSMKYQKVDLEPVEIIISHDTEIDKKDPRFQIVYKKWKDKYSSFSTNN